MERKKDIEMKNLGIVILGILVLVLSGCGLRLEEVGERDHLPEFMVRHEAGGGAGGVVVEIEAALFTELARR